MILRSLWWRPTRARPVRAALTVLGVALGVASVVGTLLASRAAVASLGADVEAIAGAARLEITRPGGVAVEDLGPLRPVARDALFAPVVEETALSEELGDVVRLLGVDLLLDGGVRDVELVGGEGANGVPAAARESMLLGRGAALSRSLADRLGVGVGDTLDLVVRSRPVELEVAALVAPARFASVWERVVLVDVALAQELAGRVGWLDRVELVPRAPDADVSALAARVRARLPESYRVAPASERREEGERMVRALEFNLTALAGVSVLVGVVLVATTLATSVVQRRPQLALLRSLGASRAQLARAVLVEAAAIGLGGGTLGVLLGLAAARGAVSSMRATVATVVETLPGSVELDAREALVGVALGVGASVVAAALPLREALRTPPLQGLRGEHPESVARRRWAPRAAGVAGLAAAAALFASLPPLGDRPVWALVAALCLLSTLLVASGPLVDLFASARWGLGRTRAGVSLRLAQAALEAGRGRASWAAGAVGVAVALAVAMTTLVGSFRFSVVEWTEQAMPSDLFLGPVATASGASAGRVAPEVVRIAREVVGDGNVDPFHQSEAYVEGRRILLGGAAFDVAAREGGLPFLDGREAAEVFRAALERGGAVANEPFARRFGVSRGDTVELETPGGRIRREIVGVYRDYSGHTGRVVLDLGDFLARYPDEGPESVALFVDEGRSVEEVRAVLVSALGGRWAVEVLDNAEVRGEVLRIFERTFAVTVALQTLSGAVAALAVVVVLTALVHERRRELAVVRVLGGSRRQLFGLVLGQALLLGLAGALGGLLVGLGVGYVLVAVVNVQSFGWSLRFAPPPALFAACLAVLPACVLAGLVPAVLSLRTPLRAATAER